MHRDDNLVKIVVVSNDKIILENFENLLDSQKYILEIVPPNPRSIAEIRKLDPDIFVVDNSGVDEDVLITCQYIRNFSGSPILVLSSNHKPELVEMVLDAGADEFLIKPVSVNVLIAYLKTLTRRDRAEKKAALSIVKGNDRDNQEPKLLSY